MHYGEKDDLVVPNVYIYSRGCLQNLLYIFLMFIQFSMISRGLE
jgi:hypothetical protein